MGTLKLGIVGTTVGPVPCAVAVPRLAVRRLMGDGWRGATELGGSQPDERGERDEDASRNEHHTRRDSACCSRLRCGPRRSSRRLGQHGELQCRLLTRNRIHAGNWTRRAESARLAVPGSRGRSAAHLAGSPRPRGPMKTPPPPSHRWRALASASFVGQAQSSRAGAQVVNGHLPARGYNVRLCPQTVPTRCLAPAT